MLCVEDWLHALNWAEKMGGLPALIARSERSLAVIADWVQRTPWIEFLAQRADWRSCTSVCLSVTAPWFTALPQDARRAAITRMTELLEAEGAAYDIAGYRSAPPGLRIWAGATVDPTDVEALLPWLDWAYAQIAPRQ
jgi:phosphoserine aminotransferase